MASAKKKGKKKPSKLQTALKKAPEACREVYEDVQDNVQNFLDAEEEEFDDWSGSSHVRQAVQSARRDLSQAASRGLKHAKKNKCPALLTGFIKDAAKLAK